VSEPILRPLDQGGTLHHVVGHVRDADADRVNQHVRDAWETVVPTAENPHGPLPRLLVLLTIVTGLVDAFSYLRLSHVFVANMTGNVVFLSFSLGGASGFVWWASLLAIGTFSLGAFLGGRISTAYGAHRGRHLRTAAAGQTSVVLGAFVVALIASTPYSDPATVVLIVLLGVGMGLQNATARSLGVPDLSTTVLTLTIAGISADSSRAGGAGSKLGRRLVSILSLFLGGVCGALLVTGGDGPWALLAAGALLAFVTIQAAAAAGSTAAWTDRK
jgi:uncharacterized membrane protein YoaK (UPF0700 family)